jgi:phosphonate transport system ATP-binding protein
VTHPSKSGSCKRPAIGNGCVIPAQAGTTIYTAMLSLKHLAKSYVPGKPVLNDINLDIAARGITAIIGPSGTGKSTLIRCINRLVEPSAGEIEFEGEDLVGLSRRALRRARRRIGMVFQEYNLVERLSVMENVLSGRLGYVSPWRAWRRKFPPEDIARAFELLGVVGLAGFAGSRADSLSGGQRQRVGIARAVMQQPAVLLADEPTSSLDPKTSVEIMQLLADIARDRDIPVVINMHDVELAKRFADRIIGMSAGSVVFDGPPGNLSDATLKTIYGGEDWLQ